MTLYMVFDVESVGLHGEGYAVGYVVVDTDGNELDSRMFSCHPNAAASDFDGRKWVETNAPILRESHASPWQVRNAFWRTWLEWRAKQAVLVADCTWPVEARFLLACIGDDPVGREWQGPYPFHDVATMRLAKGLDPLAKEERLHDNELPVHDPLADARQSARLWLAALAK
jgi:hypothetical protein